MLTRRGLIAASGLALLGVREAAAQSYPTQPIKILVGYPAGGGVSHGVTAGLRVGL